MEWEGEKDGHNNVTSASMESQNTTRLHVRT